MWGSELDQGGAEQEPGFIVSLALDGDSVVGAGLSGHELFRLRNWAPMLCETLKAKIGKSWNVESSQLRVVAADGERQIGNMESIDDVSSIMIKKTIEPASRTYARELYARWLQDLLRKEGRGTTSGLASYTREYTLREEAVAEAETTAQGASEKRAPPRLRKQKSMTSERKDKAREEKKRWVTTWRHRK